MYFMLPVYLEVSKSLARKVNYNINLIIEFFFECCEALDSETFLQEIFPPFYLRKDIKKCEKIVGEIKEMAMDSYDRYYLKPTYEYALFMLLEWWLNTTDIDMDTEVNNNDIKLPDDQYLANNINNICAYKDFMFEDWDFLNIAELFDCYIKNPYICTEVLHIVLDDYVDLMPDDIREEYERHKLDTNKKSSIIFSDEDFVVKSIYNSIQQLELHPIQIKKYSEVELSNILQNILMQSFNEKGLIINREMPAGFALKQTGELDFFIYRYINNIYNKLAISENKEWGKFESSLEQLIGYMDNNITFGFTIIFNKTTKLSTILNNRLEILKMFNINGNFKVVGPIEELPDLKYVLKTRHENPEQEGTYFNIYHFVINSYKPEREDAAKQARA